MIYILCATTFFLLATSNLLMLLGMFSVYSRVAGLCCTALFSCLNLAAIVTTAVYRFNQIGQLASLSKAPTQYDESAQWHSISNERTYSDDAKMIIVIWFVQLFFCIFSFCVQGMIFKPIKADQSSKRRGSSKSTKHILYSAETQSQNFV